MSASREEEEKEEAEAALLDIPRKREGGMDVGDLREKGSSIGKEKKKRE
jgi:hypothetical protein